MDRYDPRNRTPVPRKWIAVGEAVKERTPRDAVFVTGSVGATWIPVLTGRRVLIHDKGRLQPRDRDLRKEIERRLVTSNDLKLVREAAARYGITHLVVDEALMHAYGASRFEQLPRGRFWRTLIANSAARVVELEQPAGPPGPGE
jgi:hypothetical protein